MEMDPTARFTGRAGHYARARPGYPQAVFDLLSRECGLGPASVVADIGSGTGLSTEPFLKLGSRVFAVEPNDGMRRAAEGLLARYPRFTSVAGAAEATGLEASSVDLVVAAQAFHWFDQERAREEFARVLRPGGRVALFWNDRKTEETPFLRAYEALLHRLGTDYARVCHRNIDEAVFQRFFAPGGFQSAVFENAQSLDREGLLERSLSASYVPARGRPGHEAMMRGLSELFDACQENGRVTIEYTTRVFYGKQGARSP